MKYSLMIHTIVAVLLFKGFHCDDAAVRILTRAQEEKAITTFLDLTTSLSNTTLNNQLDLMANAIDGLLTNIPADVWGENGVVTMRNLSITAQNMKLSEDLIAKQETLWKLSSTILKLQEQRGAEGSYALTFDLRLLALLTYLSNIDAEETKLQEKYVSAGKKLRESFSSEGIERYKDLFNMLSRMENADLVMLWINAKTVFEREKRFGYYLRSGS